MRRDSMASLLIAGCFFCALAHSEDVTPQVVLPQALTWTSPPNNPGLQGAWALGEEKKAGPYILRVKLASGARIPPHTHPDERNSTVLSGTLYVGFGKTFDESKVVAIPAGGVYVAPANVAHYVWAKDGEVVYQEAGIAPTGTIPAK